MNKEIQQLSAEQAMDLAALVETANDQPLIHGQEPEAEPADKKATLAAEISGIIDAVVAVLNPALPSLGRIYTPVVTGAVSSGISAVCIKHGWLAGGLIGDYAEEFTAAIVILPLAVATYQGVKADIAAIKPAKPKADTTLDPGQDTVIAGVSMMAEKPAGAVVSFGKPTMQPSGASVSFEPVQAL